jgi:hypothetical protein
MGLIFDTEVDVEYKSLYEYTVSTISSESGIEYVALKREKGNFYKKNLEV